MWTVIDIADDYIQPKTGWHKKRYLCECSCENHTRKTVLATHLKNGSSTNCGCIRKQKMVLFNTIAKKKYNTYDLTGEYGIGYLSDGKEFYFDLEDYEKIKDYWWYQNYRGYIVSNKNNTEIALHILVMDRVNIDSDKQEIDHIGGKETRNDARKNNLRICSHSNNMMNRGLQSNNKTDYTGVYYDEKEDKYISYITVNNKRIYLGIYIDINDAIKIRKEAEEKYFGEYSYDNSQKLKEENNGY